MTRKRNQINSSPVGSPLSGNISDSSSKEQDRFLPIANVSRIMKKSLPANAKISKEAKETVQECVSEFISFITGEASDKCQREKRKTINGDDLLWAMTTLGFENYVGPLKLYLNKYRETEGEKNSMATSRQEDHPSPPPPHPTNNTYHGNFPTTHLPSTEANKVNGSLSNEAAEHLHGLNSGFYSLGAQATLHVKSAYGHDHQNPSFIGTYGVNTVGAGAFNMSSSNSRIRENGDRNNGDRALVAQIHHGVEWF
ncbi:hypothetical protein Tsubulata_039881 [Turnera subulata]|uniref:Transcription factor CBF/NF-Y/archaeal histone domain-containing protein n=1 Tax=Turnera subulata TaxID=218843 RepID=A0A9Q0JI09_9ROSI|nr:hypothetical protein Tsubulata_039881 [Turnera subulata]